MILPISCTRMIGEPITRTGKTIPRHLRLLNGPWKVQAFQIGLDEGLGMNELDQE